MRHNAARVKSHSTHDHDIHDTPDIHHSPQITDNLDEIDNDINNALDKAFHHTSMGGCDEDIKDNNIDSIY